MAPFDVVPAELDDADPVARVARGLRALLLEDAVFRVVFLAAVDLLAVERLVWLRVLADFVPLLLAWGTTSSLGCTTGVQVGVSAGARA
ncbi:MAG TPA: hypothetical protein VGF91_21210 [Solirubrobacteraceae bacterium]